MLPIFNAANLMRLFQKEKKKKRKKIHITDWT